MSTAGANIHEQEHCRHLRAFEKTDGFVQPSRRRASEKIEIAEMRLA